MRVQVLDIIGDFPVIIRPAFTLGGTGGGIAYNMEEFKEIMDQGLTASVTNQVLHASPQEAPKGPKGPKGLKGPPSLGFQDHTHRPRDQASKLAITSTYPVPWLGLRSWIMFALSKPPYPEPALPKLAGTQICSCVQHSIGLPLPLFCSLPQNCLLTSAVLMMRACRC